MHEPTPQTARQRVVLRMLAIAELHDPGLTWDQLVRVVPHYGASCDPPVRAAEVRALRDVRIGDLFDPAPPSRRPDGR
jgi:hypothetical protein